MLLTLLSVRPAPRPHGVSVSMSALDLDERYAAIAAALPRQRAAYTEWVASDAVDGPALTAAASAVGIHLDVAGGQISYAPDFEQKRVPLCSQNLLVRLPRLDCKARFRYQPTPRATAAAFRHDAKPIGAF